MGQNMRRIFADVYTSQSGFYDVEKISPVFYGVEAAVNRVPDSDGSTSQGKSSNTETHDVINGFWEGVFDLTLPLEKRTTKVSETFELRSKLGPSTAHLKRSDNPSQDLSQFAGRGGNDFGIFTIHGTYNRKTCELKALKLYDPVVKKRSQSTDKSQSPRNQVSDGRTSKRRRKVSQIIRLREQQALAFKKAEEDAILQKQNVWRKENYCGYNEWSKKRWCRRTRNEASAMKKPKRN